MAKMTVADLMESLKDVPLTANVVFQGNVWSGEEKKGAEPEYTTTLGYVYSAWKRDDKEFVIDGAITENENGETI